VRCGYVELNFARRVDIGYGDVRNAAENFIRAAPETIVAADFSASRSVARETEAQFMAPLSVQAADSYGSDPQEDARQRAKGEPPKA
jgi:hypothetical protein